ncbi:MAG: inorganic phosphate transporter [Pseudonocardiaceae bacterium]
MQPGDRLLLRPAALTIAIFVLLVALAAANGSNDVPKGVATLAGAGVARYRTAIAWGTITTLAGALCSLALAGKLTALFSKGIVSATPTPAFALAVLVGAGAWVALATATKLPVSTTHALIGALIGAGLLLSASSVQFAALGTKVVLPLLASIAVAYVLSLLLSLIPLRVPECVCVEVNPSIPGAIAGANGSMAFTTSVGLPVVSVTSGSAQECAAHAGQVNMLAVVNALHWLSSGATSFARGLNDTPKIVAIGAFALVPAGMSTTGVLLTVALAMAVGSLVGGLRVAKRLGEGVVRMSHVEGFKANLTTSVLVGLGATQGLPMSTTHVSTGAIAGAAGRDVARLNRKTLRDFAIAWTVTPIVAALIAVVVYLLAR